MKKILAIVLVPVLAVAAIGSIALGAGVFTFLIERPGHLPLALVVMALAIFVAAWSAEFCHRLILFIESADAPRGNRHARRHLAGSPTDR